MIGSFNAVGVFQLVIAVVIFGLVWYFFKKKRLISDGTDDDKARSKAKDSAIQASIIFWVFFIVNEIGLFSYLFELIS